MPEENKWNSRKLIVVGAAILLAFGAMWSPDVTARTEFYDLLKWIGGSYLGGQSLVDAAARFKMKP